MKFKSKRLLAFVLAAVMIFTVLPWHAQAAGGENLALNKPASASNVEAGTTFTADKAVDGDKSTRWATDKDVSNPWIEVDLADGSTVKQVDIYFERADADQNILSYTIEVYANGSYTTVHTHSTADGRAAQHEKVILPAAVTADKLKLTITSYDGGQNPNWPSVSVAELEVYADVVVGIGDVLDSLNAYAGTVVEGDTFQLPEVPNGYTIELNGCDYEQIIAKDLTVVRPLVDKVVYVSYVVTDSQGNSATTGDIAYTVKGLHSEDISAYNAKPQVVPEIQEWYTTSNAKLAVATLTKVTYDNAALKAVVDEFVSDYEAFTGIKLAASQGAAQANAFNFSMTAPDALLGDEGYTMDIQADRINVASVSTTGNMYGMQTILQMYKLDSEGYAIGTMRDYPRFEVRGLLLDIARKPIAMTMVRYISRTMRYYKMNDLQLHLNDNYIWLEEYGTYANEDNGFNAYEAFRLESSLTNADGEDPTAEDYAISKKEMREFIQSERALGMNIVPEIDVPAHAMSFTRVWPELSIDNEMRNGHTLIDHFDLRMPAAIAKIKEIFDDYTKGENPTFDSETVVHIGADEFYLSGTNYRQFFNEMVPYIKETNTIRLWGSLTYMNDNNQTKIIPEAIEDVQMNLWSAGWANYQDMFNMGFHLINTIDTYGYMVPNGNGGRGAYGDYLNLNSVFNEFKPNKVGSIELPASDERILGAAFAIWNDNIDRKSSGLTESDVFHRFFDALPFYAEKNWATTGQEKGSAAALTALSQKIGIAPNIDPYFQVSSNGDLHASYNFDDMTDGSGNGRDLIAGTATLADGALVLAGGNSYISTPIVKIGNGNSLSFDITLTEAPAPGDIILECDSEYDSHDLRIMEDGTLGFTRELHDYSFGYTLPVNTKVNICIVAEQQTTSLYVNNELVGTATGKFVHNGEVKKTGITHATFAIPMERIGSETNAISAVIDNLRLEKLLDPSDDSRDIPIPVLTATAGDWQTGYEDTEGPADLVLDEDPSTLWHTDWYGTDRSGHWIQFALSEDYIVDGLRYQPRQVGGSNGTILEYEIQVSDDGVTFRKITSGTWANNKNWKVVSFDGVQAKYVRLVAKNAVSDNNYVFASAAEIRLTGEKPTGECQHANTEIRGAVDATCEDPGYTGDTYCVDCDVMTAEGTEIEALGHDYVDGVCSRCGEADPDYEAPVNENVIRLAGSNRYETALLAADEMKAVLGAEKFDAIIIASGNDFADALAGSYLATVKNAPILLSYGGNSQKYAYLDTDNIEYVKNNLVEGGTVYILGGKNAVPELYETGLEGYNVVRLGGANRFETNILILEEAGIAKGAEVLVCTATNFADSLSASATGMPILLVWNARTELYGNQPEFLAGLKEKNCTFTILGGESAVSAELANAVAAYGEVDRLAGTNRMETSVMVARKYFDQPEKVVLAYAWNYPDGLCGGSLAYALGAPLILTMPKYEAAAAEYTEEFAIDGGYVLGGDTLITEESVQIIFPLKELPSEEPDDPEIPEVDDREDAPAPDDVVPDANQYRYQKEELSAFCHFGPNTFNEIEWGEHYGNRHPSEIFTLTQDFDADTFVRTLKEAGFQKLIVTAKHHDGFCIWDSKWTEYDVAASGYKDANGQSDILAEISAACTKYDMDMGLYLSPWDIHDASYGYYDANGNATNAAGDVLDYNEYYNNQLIEILSSDKYGNNGHFNEIWMDGAKGSGANAQDYDFVTWFNTIQKYEGKEAGYDADCMLFGAEAYTTVRWIGNENGYAAEETWSKSNVNYTNNTIDSNNTGHYTQGFENGNKWTVPESDARITSGWFWGTTKCTPKSIGDLATMYFNSVGHNSVLLLNVPPNNQGTVDKAILDRVTEFGNEIRQTFDDNLAEGATITASEIRNGRDVYGPANVLDGNDDTYWTVNDGTASGTLTLDLGGTKVFDVVSIEEAIQFGQRIKSFRVEYRNGDSDDWKTFDEGTTIGAKRLSRKSPVRADQVRITVTTSSAVPMITEVGLFKASEGFELAGGMPMGMECIDITDSEFVLTGGWTHETGAQYTNGTNAWANGNANGSNKATLTFTGTKVYLIGTVDAAHGKADIYLDGTKVASIDTNGSPRAVGQVIYASDDLSDGQHTLELRCTQSGKAIGLEAAYVINNGGLGMVGIENARYTMNEDSEMQIKLVRTGGSNGSVTVTLSPNPGTAIQDDFDTENIQTITFANGETEKYATVRTTRNYKETGDQYFTVELSSDHDDLILGLNDKATITIRDTESLPDPSEQYSAAYPYQFPTTVGASATLEADMAILYNNTDNETWKLSVAEGSWAGNGKFVDSLNRGDRMEIPYNAEVAGTYTVTVTYRSGSNTNYLAWSEANGKILSGTASAGHSDSTVTRTATFTITIAEAGAGTWIFAPTDADSPQMDKFDITLTSAS